MPNKQIMDILFPRQQALRKQGRCPLYEQPTSLMDMPDRLYRAEHAISGLCATCQDEMFAAEKHGRTD